MKIRPCTKRCLQCLLTIAIMLSAALLPASAAATGGRYQNVNRNKVVFIVEVGSPAPSSLIVEHFHPRGNQLVNSSPRADKINNANGSAKWFLKNVRPGVYPFSLSFSESVSPRSLQLRLRYNDPSSGSYRETVVLP